MPLETRPCVCFFLNCQLLCEFSKIINVAKWRKCYMSQFWGTHVPFSLQPWFLITECFTLFSGLVVFAMQVECMQVGFHTVQNHSVLKNPGPCKGHISKKLLLQINVSFYKITPTVSEKKILSCEWHLYDCHLYRSGHSPTARLKNGFESLEHFRNDKCGESLRCSWENSWVVSL